MLIRELVDGQEIDQVLLVRAHSAGKVTLGDRTGTVVARLEEPARCCVEPGSVVHVAGRYELTARGPEVRVRELRAAAEEEYALDTLIDGPPRSAEGMEADLRELIATIQDRHLRALLDTVLGAGTETWNQFRDAPAARRSPRGYRHGLLEHSLGVARASRPSRRPSAGSTATSRSPARCCTTSASWTPTRRTLWPST